MNSSIIQIIVLLGIVIFLVIRLKNVLGTREGFEKPPVGMPGVSEGPSKKQPQFEVVEGGLDRDISDHVEEDSPTAEALAQMKGIDPSFGVGDFLEGARGAYEWILMAFEKGDLGEVRDFLAPEVHDGFLDVIEERERQGLSIEANFVGVREITLVGATYNEATGEGEVSVKFVAELTSVVKNAAGEIVEGDATQIKRQRDVWTFGRIMGSDDPNWQLVATGE